MQDMFRTFVGLSVFAGAVLYICPEGGARRILRLLSAAILTAIVLSTMGTFDYDLLNLEEARFAAAAAELSNRKELFELFRDAKINLSFLGFGLEIDGEPPIHSNQIVEVILQKS